MRWISLPLLLVSACVEYEVVAPEIEIGVSNPRDLESALHEDRHEQIASRSVDILWVLDSSCSMVDENAALAEWFPNFIRHFEDVEADYRIGVTTTDMGSGQLSSEDRGGAAGELRHIDDIWWIDAQTPDPLGVFAQMTSVYSPLSRSAGVEKGREATYTALELRNEDNHGFLRQDADAFLHITLISDEDDSSTRDPIGKADFVDWLHRIRPAPNRVSFNSIVTLEPQDGQETVGEKYIDLSEGVGGEIFDLQALDWPNMLDVLGGLQSPVPVEEWFLGHPPVLDSLDVLVEHAGTTFVFALDEDYTFDPVRNSITFVGFEPPEGSTVILRYLRADEAVGQ